MIRLALLLVSLTCWPALAQVNADARILDDFNRRIAEYGKLHKAAQSQVHKLKPTESSEAIAHYTHHLARRLREVRAGAAPGDIFTPAIAAEMRRLIGLAMHGPDAVHIRESLQRAAPVHSVALRVDRTYPESVPLQSTPPSLLVNLPPLPADLDYRFIGPNLVLRDIDANLVIDFVTNAIPSS